MSRDVELFWLGTHQDRASFSGQRIRWSDALETPFLKSELEMVGDSRPQHNVVLGMIALRPLRRHSRLDILDEHQLAQVRGWSACFRSMETRLLHNKLVFFSVVDVWLLPEPAVFPRHGGGNNWGPIVRLEEGSHQRLFELFRNNEQPPFGPAWFAIRLPAVWATLVMAKRWSTFSVPDITDGARIETLKFNWAFTSFDQPDFRKILYEGEPQLTQDSWQDCADALRKQFHGRAAEGMLPDDELREMERLI